MSSYKTSRAREMLAMQPMKTTGNKNVKTTSEAVKTTSVRLKGCQQMKNFGNMSTGKRKQIGDDQQEDSPRTKRTRDTPSLLQEDTASQWGDSDEKFSKGSQQIGKNTRKGGKIGNLINIFELHEEADILGRSPFGKAILKCTDKTITRTGLETTE